MGILDREVYEKKTYDEVFPAEVFIEHRNQTGLYFWPHWHEETEILYITEGSARFQLEQNEYVAEKGSILVINSNELHSGYVETTPYLCKVLSLKPANFLKDMDCQTLRFQPIISPDSQIVKYMEDLFAEYTAQPLAYRDNCKAMVTQLLVYLIRHYASDSLTDKLSEKRKKNLDRLSQVLSYIGEHYPEHITNQELASMMHLSEDRFGHLFRKNVGMAPQQYVTETRLEKAKELIQSTDFTITEISRMVGFQDYNHFGRQFQKRYRCTPRELIKQNVFVKSPHN